MKTTLPFLLLAAIATPLAAQDTPAPAIPEKADLAKLKVDKLYATLCATCHAPDLTGGLGPSLVDGEWKHGNSDAEIAHIITKGNLQLGMTPWEGILSADQTRALVIFFREKEQEALTKTITYPTPEPGVITKTDRASYTIETLVAEGLDHPWAIAFLPDGSRLITERPGRLRLVDASGKLHPNPVADTPKVITHGQGGLLEVAVHPDYKDNGWIYLGIADGWSEKVEGKDKPQPRTITAVVRGRIKNHQWIDHQDIWKADKQFYIGSGAHFGTRFAFSKGYLYFIVGERGGNEIAQDLSNPAGKIYRVHDDGRIPADNPFADNKNAVPGIWSYGHRNPQGLDIDPRDGSLYNTEHGPRGGDELNRVLPGRNYGWPLVTLGMNYDGTPLGKTSAEGIEPPVTHWTPSIAVCGTDFYRGTQFPGWQNDLLVGALKQQEIRRLRIVDHKVTEQEIILKNIGRVRDVATGPDGLVYILLNKPDRLVRLLPAS
jgi:glucose/arabinose dehydrogenase